MDPDRETRTKALAALFAAMALILVGGPRASVGNVSGCTITGTPGRDLLFGTHGRDVICGLGGNDVLDGNDGDDNDTIFAWDGFADRLDGGRGSDHAWRDKLDHVSRIERFS
jgi:Ca2+-binding RTX toxin-like protein